MTGKIKFYNQEKLWGFIVNDEGGELFFHLNDLLQPNATPKQDDLVSFEIGEGKNGKPKAIKIKLI